MSDDDLHLEGAAFLKEQTAGLYEPHGSKALGETAERSSKQVRAVAAAIPHWQRWREAASQIKAYAIANLDKLQSERVLLIAVPLRIRGRDGSPCRAVAIDGLSSVQLDAFELLHDTN